MRTFFSFADTWSEAIFSQGQEKITLKAKGITKNKVTMGCQSSDDLDLMVMASRSSRTYPGPVIQQSKTLNVGFCAQSQLISCACSWDLVSISSFQD